MRKLCFVFGIFTLILLGCTPSSKDVEGPVITIFSPTGSEMFTSGDTLNVHADITDNVKLQNIAVTITRTHMGVTETVFSDVRNTSERSVVVQAEYIIQVPGMHNDFEVTVSGTDNNGNLGIDSVGFHVHM